MISTGIFYEGNGVAIRAWHTKVPTRGIKGLFTEAEFRELAKDPTKLWEVKARLMGQVAKVLEGGLYRCLV